MNIKPVNIWASRYMSPVERRRANAIDSATIEIDVSLLLCINSNTELPFRSVHLMTKPGEEGKAVDSQVVGKTIKTRTMLRVLGNSLSPATSTPTGAIVDQNVPQTIPARIAKRHKTEKFFAKIQMKKHIEPQNPVVSVAILIRPSKSLECPTRGRPIIRPKFSSAPTIAPSFAVRPMLRA